MRSRVAARLQAGHLIQHPLANDGLPGDGRLQRLQERAISVVSCGGTVRKTWYGGEAHMGEQHKSGSMGELVQQLMLLPQVLSTKSAPPARRGCARWVRQTFAPDFRDAVSSGFVAAVESDAAMLLRPGGKRCRYALATGRFH